MRDASGKDDVGGAAESEDEFASKRSALIGHIVPSSRTLALHLGTSGLAGIELVENTRSDHDHGDHFLPRTPHLGKSGESGQHARLYRSLHAMKAAAFIAALVPATAALYVNGSVTAPCESPLYCQGEILREIQLAGAFEDSKTYVDLPTIRPLEEVIAAFNNLTKPLTNNTELNDFLSEYFGEAGSELGEVNPDELTTNATFLENVTNADIRDFLQQVIDIWPELTREYVGSANCTGCVSSFIPLNRTFVVAGGRFREPYYVGLHWSR